jgi:hypothetical protein
MASEKRESVKFTHMPNRTGSKMLKSPSNKGKLRAVVCIAPAPVTVKHPSEI